MEKINGYTNEYLQKVIAAFQPHSPAPLTLDDAREITDNMIEFALILLDIDSQNAEKQRRKSA